MASELLPCPFCGGEPMRNDLYAWCDGSNGAPHMLVQQCFAAWNTRATPDALAAKDAEIARLTAENERLREALEIIVADNRIDLENGGYVEFSKSEDECREIAYAALTPRQSDPQPQEGKSDV